MKFSIVVPIYNVEKYLEQCIESVLNQSYTNFELILVDDGSFDTCPSTCDQYAEKDHRIKVIHKKNAGLPAARNSGIKMAQGDYLMHLDADDFWDLQYLSKLNIIIEESPKDVYFGNSRYDYYSEDNCRKTVLYNIDTLKNKKINEIISHFFYKNNQMPSGAWHNVYRTAFVKENNLFFSEELTWSEDADNFFNVLTYAKSIGFFDYTFYYYRRSNISAMTKNITAKNLLSNLAVSKKWFWYFEQSDYTEETRGIVKQRFAKGYLCMTKFLAFLNKEDFDEVVKEMKNNKDIIKDASGMQCIALRFLNSILGYRTTSKIINLVIGK